MTSQGSASRSRFLLAGLTSIKASISKLEERRLALEDLILQHLFGSPEGSVLERAQIGDIELLEVLPSRYSPVNCAHYLAWTMRPDEVPYHEGAEEHLQYADAMGHLVAARTETAVFQPMADVTAVIHPDVGKDEAVALVLKLGAVIDRAGIHHGPAALYTGRDIGGSPILQKGEGEVAATPAEEPPSVPGRKERFAASISHNLREVLMECFVAAEEQVLGATEKQLAALRTQMAKLEDDLERLHQLEEQFGRLTWTVSEQKAAERALQESFEQFAASLKHMQEAETRQVGQVESLRAEFLEFLSQTKTVSARLGQHEDELAAFRGSMDGILERLNRHADVIRSMNEVQALHTDVLRRIGEFLNQLDSRQ